jgi:fermentation-respiration switch protein FrsA (DUF1100 family)
MRVLRYVSLVEALPAVGPFNRTRYPVRVVPGTSYLDAFRDALDRLDLERRVPGLGAIPCPVLIAHGRRDGIVPFDQAVRLERAFGAQAELFGEETGRHLDLLLRPRTLARIGDWIRAVES